jgi:hypothetical protein
MNKKIEEKLEKGFENYAYILMFNPRIADWQTDWQI